MSGAVRLGKETVTGTIRDPIFRTVTEGMTAFPCGSDNRCPITGDGKIRRINQSFGYGTIQEFPMIDLKQGSIGLFI